MKSYSYKTFENFVQMFDLSEYGEDDLIISDIDGVFFRGIYDPREIIGIISKKNLKVFNTLLNTKCGFWIFTNRLKLFKGFPFIRQLFKILSAYSKKKVEIYTNSLSFLEAKIEKYAIIMNAKKPNQKSQKVVEKGIENYRKIIYIGSQDTPFYYTDKNLLKRLSKKRNLDNLTFIEINSWKKDSQ